MTTTAPDAAQPVTGERADLLDALAKHRHFLRYTAQGLSDAQANTTAAASALTVGGLIKHVADVEAMWAHFMTTGKHPGSDSWSDGGGEYTPEMIKAWEEKFRLAGGETLQRQLDAYEKVASTTDELIRSGIDLDTRYELPEAPWQPPGVFWSVRRVVVHILAETAQHAGHADIIREAIDGQKSMG